MLSEPFIHRYCWQIDCVEAGDDDFDKSDDDERLKFPGSEIGR